MNSIAHLRKEYSQKALLENEAATNPIDQFAAWWHDVQQAEIEEANAMTLATANRNGEPSARVVLLKGFDQQGFVFFTNYQSSKGRELEENPKACINFFWKELERQVRISGSIEKTKPEESDEYFHSRPRGSRIGAWVSPQSSKIPDRDWLTRQEHKMEMEMGNREVERPPHWGGYRLKPASIEFWQGRPNRLHDRLLYTLQAEGTWVRVRLAP